MEQSVDDHTHCDRCIRRGCHEGCPMTSCDQFCGAVFHGCKQSEHTMLCPLVRVPCINKGNGCPHIMPRHRLGIHLQTCPASVICCTNEWNRRPVSDKHNSISVHMLSGGGTETKELDVALMLRDQRFLNMALEWNNNKQLPVTSLATPYCSSQVIRHSNMTSFNEHFNPLPPAPPPGLKSSICEQLFKSPAQSQNGSTSHGVNFINNQPGSKEGLPSPSRNCDITCDMKPFSEQQHYPNALASENSVGLPIPGYPVSPVHFTSTKPNTEMSDTSQANKTPVYHNSNKQVYPSSSANSTPVLCLDLTIDSLTRYQPKQDSIFTFMCAQVFRRDQYAAHVKNIHSEIYAGLNGWLVQRCPLACYGCPFSVRRMYPNSERSQVVYSEVIESFGIQPSVDEKVYQRGNSDSKDKSVPLLVELPTEVLEHIARFLDGFSLNNLALTCRLLRDICYNILPDKGIVVEEWQSRLICGQKHWYIARNMWLFTNNTTDVEAWGIDREVFRLTEHLMTCEFNEKHIRTARYKVISTE